MCMCIENLLNSATLEAHIEYYFFPLHLVMGQFFVTDSLFAYGYTSVAKEMPES